MGVSSKIDTSQITNKDNIKEYNKKHDNKSNETKNIETIANTESSKVLNEGTKSSSKIIMPDYDTILDYVLNSGLFDFFEKIGFKFEKTSKEVESKLQRETFKKWISQYENVWLYNFFNGTGSYESVSKYVTEDGKYYIAYDDNYQFFQNGSPKPNCNFGFGIHYWNADGYNNTNVTYFKELGIDITDPKYLENGKAKMPVEIVEAVKNKVIDGNIQTVKNFIGEENYNKLTVEQQYTLVDICYHGCDKDDWNELRIMLDEDRSPEYVVENWDRITSTKFNNEDRKNARVELWLNGNYIDASGNPLKIQ